MIDPISCWTVDLSGSDDLYLHDTKEHQQVFENYSQFKFGNTESINWFSKQLFSQLKTVLENPESPLSKMFSVVAETGANIYFTSPGIRNVPSASNLLLEQTGLLLNKYLAIAGRPTGIVRTLPRLGSGRANYAELSTSERTKRKKTTQTIFPLSDYKNNPIHVVFVDDLIASGSTAERARTNSLEGGALSFHSCSLLSSTAAAAAKPEFEHQLNTYSISGALDGSVALCLSSQDYTPVQRMLRLLLHPKNTFDLIEFVDAYVSRQVVAKICAYALGNDYLAINAKPDGIGLYAPSLTKLLEYESG